MTGPAFLSVAFRPFFLGAAGFAVFAIASWVTGSAGGDIVAPAIGPQRWHAHEMIFGYGAGVIAGFLLTAVANWTGRPAVRGWRLGLLLALWAAARVAMAMSQQTGLLLAALLDSGFLVTITAVLIREISAAKNWRNLPVCVATGMLAVASALSHFGAGLPAGIDLRLGIAAICTLIILVGGRIIPAFTRNWMVKMGHDKLPAPFARFDRAAIAAAAIALLSWTVMPRAQISGALLLLAAVFHLARLVRWRGAATLSEPLVTILHIGYLWLPAGFALLGASIVNPALVPATVALHGLTAGAIAVMTIAIMTRATLGHCGRPLHADGITVVIYLLINFGALARISAPWLPLDYATSTLAAGLIWGGGFALFAVSYGPLLLAARAPA